MCEKAFLTGSFQLNFEPFQSLIVSGIVIGVNIFSALKKKRAGIRSSVKNAAGFSKEIIVQTLLLDWPQGLK